MIDFAAAPIGRANDESFIISADRESCGPNAAALGQTMDVRDYPADKVRKLIADYLEIDVKRVMDEANLSDDLGIDWLDQLDLLVMIEDEFAGVQFSDGTAVDFVGDIIRYVELRNQNSSRCPSVVSAHRRSAA